jgi:hypothetical protein
MDYKFCCVNSSCTSAQSTEHTSHALHLLLAHTQLQMMNLLQLSSQAETHPVTHPAPNPCPVRYNNKKS